MASQFSAARNAIDYAYGINPAVDALQVVGGGSTAGGTYSVTLAVGVVYGTDGSPIFPTTTTPITIGSNATLETVTPSAVSNLTPSVYGTCVITATFTNAHGIGDQVRSGSGGIVEAINSAHTRGGGLVTVDIACQNAVASSHANLVTFLETLLGFTNVSVLDWTGTTLAKSYTSTSNGAALTATAISLY